MHAINSSSVWFTIYFILLKENLPKLKDINIKHIVEFLQIFSPVSPKSTTNH